MGDPDPSKSDKQVEEEQNQYLMRSALTGAGIAVVGFGSGLLLYESGNSQTKVVAAPMFKRNTMTAAPEIQSRGFSIAANVKF